MARNDSTVEETTTAVEGAETTPVEVVEKTAQEKLDAALAKLNSSTPASEKSPYDAHREAEVVRVREAGKTLFEQLGLQITDESAPFAAKAAASLSRAVDSAVKAVKAVKDEDIVL